MNFPKTLLEATNYFSDQSVCLEFVAEMRWPGGVATCPKCDGTETSFLKTRKIWKCKSCKKQFSVKSGSIFEGSAIGLDKWLTAMWLIANCKNGISSYEIHRDIGVTQKTAWFMSHRIRTAMKMGSFTKMTGTIEMDEAFIGGDAKNMHRSKRVRFSKPWTRNVKDHKTAVFGMVQRGGKVRAKVLPGKRTGGGVRTDEVMPIIQENVEPASEVFTDQAMIYRHLWEQYVHDTVNHSVEYVRGNVHTNSIENFWSLLKRTIKGTYISVSPEHLQKYVEEQAFRYNEREDTDQGRFLKLVESVKDKRLTYKDLTS